jgi:hypothetical protein
VPGGNVRIGGATSGAIPTERTVRGQMPMHGGALSMALLHKGCIVPFTHLASAVCPRL